MNEDTVKFGIRKYLGKHLNYLEKGLRITKVERAISKKDRPDFQAKDREGKTVLIECKGSATPDNLDQLARYGKTYRASRLMLAAFRISDKCKDAAKKKSRFELYECELKFKRLRI